MNESIHRSIDKGRMMHAAAKLTDCRNNHHHRDHCGCTSLAQSSSTINTHYITRKLAFFDLSSLEQPVENVANILR